jgi:hypothetical protein
MLGLGSLDLFMRLIWQTTLVLVAVGLLLMTGLVLHRLFEEWRDKRHRPAREALRRRLLTDLNAPSSASPSPMAHQASPGRLPIGETARLVDELAQIVRGDAKVRLAAFAEATGVERYWLKRLRSRLAPYRHEAARCLALFETSRTRTALGVCLATGDGRLRLAAAEALAHQPALAAELVAHLLDDPAARGRHAARFWHRIAMVAPQVLVAHLTPMAGKPQQLSRMIEALGDAGHVAAAGPIEALVEQEGEAVDRAALVALQRLQHPAMLRVARKLATAIEPETRRAALVVLKDRARPGDLDLIQKLAADPLTDIKVAAQAILERLTASTATGAMPA